MSILKMEKMTWEDIKNLDKSKSVVFAALSPIEEHGPHLPLGTDYISAVDLLEEVVNELEKQNNKYNYIVHPPFPIGYNECIMNFPGTISFREKTIENVIVDFGESVARCGFNKMVIINHHLDLGHIKSIENAKAILYEKYSLKVLENASRIIYAENKKCNEDTIYDNIDMEKEIHADFRETSFMLFKHKDLVKACYKDLEPVYMNVEQFVKNGGRYWDDYGIKAGYIGSPAKASSEHGRTQFESMIKTSTDLIKKFIKSGYIPELSQGIKIALNHIKLR